MGSQGTDIAALQAALSKQRFLSSADAKREARFRNSAVALRRKVLTNQDAVWCHLGDSTANGTDEWLYLAADVWRGDFPNMRVTHELWNDTSQAYDAPTVMQAGVSDNIPAPTVRDTFTRTETSLNGDYADTGQPWNAGSTAGPVDGNYYVGNAVEVSIQHGLDPNGPEGIRAAGRVVKQAGSTSLARVYLLRVSNTDELFVEIGSAAPNITLNLYKRVAGVVTGLTGANSFTLDNTVDRVVDFEVSVVGGVVTASYTCNGTVKTQSGAINQPTSWAGFGTTARYLHLVGNGPKWDFIEIGLGAPAPKSLRIINGSMPGASFTYQQARVAAMVPVAPDLVTLAGSHNNGTQTVAAFQQQTEDLVAAVLAKYPSAGIALVSQNPQFSPKPADQAAAHNLRIAATGTHADLKGWGYIAAAEKFLTQADRGKSLVSADGIHPAPAGWPLWRDAALTFLRTGV